MRNVRAAGQALRLAADSSRQPYICHSCARQFSSTATAAAATRTSFWKNIKESMFGTKESKRVKASREEKQKKTLEKVAKTGQTDRTVKSHGVVYQYAKLVSEETHPGYEPARNWDGLERVGGEKWVKERADTGEKYSGFMRQGGVQLDNEQWQKLLHHIAVEVFLLQQAGRDPLDVCNARTVAAQNELLTAGAAILPVDGVISFSGISEGQKQEILEAIEEEASVLSEDSLKTELDGPTSKDVELTSADGKIGWMQLDLDDPIVKLAILKRVVQLTGRRVPDFEVSKATTLADLYHAFKVREKPAKLAADPEIQALPEQIPNVKVHRTRRTILHKEKEIGRWKLIEDELDSRGLPIFGSNYTAEDKELSTFKVFESKQAKKKKEKAARGY